jgi:hypothetical protein
MEVRVSEEMSERHVTGSHAWQSLGLVKESMVQGPERHVAGSHAWQSLGLVKEFMVQGPERHVTGLHASYL